VQGAVWARVGLAEKTSSFALVHQPCSRGRHRGVHWMCKLAVYLGRPVSIICIAIQFRYNSSQGYGQVWIL
jgi:hypothetical protein